MERLTLLELNLSVQQALHDGLPGRFWVTGEISECRLNRNGHCYIELVQKDGDSEKLVAKAQAIIFSFTYRMLRPFFETASGTVLQPGIKVLLNVNVEFHELYGFSLQVHDIDPAYTAGDLAMKKAEIIRRLEKEGVLDMNKQIAEPPVFQRIAVISSETAAGYGDFMDHLVNNEYGFVFYCKLFPALVQGDGAPQSIISALEKIFSRSHLFDAVALIRGGGAQSDLNCFNNYELGFHIAQFPLPVITGIGHERDDTVADCVAFSKQKTPTAVADFFVRHMKTFSDGLDERSGQLTSFALNTINREQKLLSGFVNRCVIVGMKGLSSAERQLDAGQKQMVLSARNILSTSGKKLFLASQRVNTSLSFRLQHAAGRILTVQSTVKKMVFTVFHSSNMKLDNFAKLIRLHDPRILLKKGYSITRHNATIVRSADMLNSGDVLETELFNEKINSKLLK